MKSSFKKKFSDLSAFSPYHKPASSGLGEFAIEPQKVSTNIIVGLAKKIHDLCVAASNSHQDSGLRMLSCVLRQ